MLLSKFAKFISGVADCVLATVKAFDLALPTNDYNAEKVVPVSDTVRYSDNNELTCIQLHALQLCQNLVQHSNFHKKLSNPQFLGRVNQVTTTCFINASTQHKAAIITRVYPETE